MGVAFGSAGAIPDHPFNDFVRASGELLGAIAWPAIVVFLAWRHKLEITKLLERLKEGWGAKFADPVVPQPTSTSAASLEQLSGADPAPSPSPSPDQPDEIDSRIEQMRTPAVQETERYLLDVVGFEPPTNTRERTFLALAAGGIVVNRFLLADTVIYASQLNLLALLNSLPQGVPRNTLKSLFYDPAVAQFPAWYSNSNSNFESYLQFLRGSGLIADAGDNVAITVFGREYLIWRVRERRPPKVSA